MYKKQSKLIKDPKRKVHIEKLAKKLSKEWLNFLIYDFSHDAFDEYNMCIDPIDEYIEKNWDKLKKEMGNNCDSGDIYDYIKQMLNDEINKTIKSIKKTKNSITITF